MFFCTIVLPVYNTAVWLPRCLESILRAEPPELPLELILVTAPSTDGSEELCHRYAAEHPGKVKVIAQTGQGLANARNCGATHAGGEYLAFFDSDDYIDSQAFARLLHRLRELEGGVDAVVTDYCFADGDKLRPIRQVGSEEQQEFSYLPTFLRRKKCFWNVWRYVYCRSYLCAHNLTFWEAHLTEDLDFTNRLLLSEPRLLFSPHAYYHYCVHRPGSLMATPSLRRFLDTLTVIAKSASLAAQSALPWAPLLREQYLYEYILTLAGLPELPQSVKGEACSAYRQTLVLLGNAHDLPARAALPVLRTFPLEVTATLLYLVKKLKRTLTTLHYK